MSAVCKLHLVDCSYNAGFFANIGNVFFKVQFDRFFNNLTDDSMDHGLINSMLFIFNTDLHASGKSK